MESGPITVEWSSFQIVGFDPAIGKLSLGYAINSNMYESAVSDSQPVIVAQWNFYYTDYTQIFVPSNTVPCPGGGGGPGEPILFDPTDPGALARKVTVQ